MRTIPNMRKSRCSSRPSSTSAFLLKHRTRADETYLFASPRAVATKIIIPFDLTDLRAGGRSLFVDQRGYAECPAHGRQLQHRRCWSATCRCCGC